MAPASTPITIEPSGVTKPHAGVIATRPATAPEAAPSVLGLPNLSCSTSSQPSTAAAVATVVLVKATPARSPAVSAEPALKPYQPNHSRLAPSITKASTGSASGPGHGTAAWVSVAATAKPARWPHVFDMPALEKLPISPPNASLENDSPNPYRIHSTDTIARQMKFIMSMFRTLFARTMPP